MKRYELDKMKVRRMQDKLAKGRDLSGDDTTEETDSQEEKKAEDLKNLFDGVLNDLKEEGKVKEEEIKEINKRKETPLDLASYGISPEQKKLRK